MDVDEIRTLCSQIRARNSTAGPPKGGPEVDDALVGVIEAEVAGYRRKFSQPRPQLPPDDFREVLPAIGWLIYEASLDRLWKVRAGFGTLPEAEQEESEAAAKLIRRLANAARKLVWPEFAGRALGAIRAQALVESKRDTEAGYDAAWILHNEADERYLQYRDTYGDDPARKDLIVVLDEVFLQLALAETGTACRTAERVIGRWEEEFSQDDSEEWTQKLFYRLVEGIETGERALATAYRIKKDPGFIHKVTEERLTLHTGLRNPSIMTTRAILLTYSLCPEMRRLGRMPPAGFTTWEDYQRDLLRRFDKAFPALLEEVRKADGQDWPLNADHRRSLVQNCLHLGLITPSHDLGREVVIDDNLTVRVLDDDAVEALSAWLGARGDDANAIGSSSKPDFNTSVEDCRTDAGAAAGYHEWRCRWLELDRYLNEHGRRERIRQILGCR